MTEQLLSPFSAEEALEVNAAPRRSMGLEAIDNTRVRLYSSETPVMSAETIGLVPEGNGYSATVVAELAFARSASQDAHAAVIRIDNGSGDVKFAVQALEVDDETGKLHIGSEKICLLSQEQTISIGSKINPKISNSLTFADIWDDTTGMYDVDVQLEINEKLLAVEVHEPNVLRVNGSWSKLYHNENRTAKIMSRLAGLNLLVEGRTVDGDKPISSDTFINGMIRFVDMRSLLGRGTVVVDDRDERNAPTYRKYMNRVQEGIASIEIGKGYVSEDDVLKVIASTIGHYMGYSKSRVDEKAEGLRQSASKLKKVNLAVYMKEGYGVCEQMGLVAAYLANKCYTLGYLDGGITVPTSDRVGAGPHEYMRFDHRDGRATIIDVAMDHVGGEIGKDWDYRTNPAKILAGIMIHSPE